MLVTYYLPEIPCASFINNSSRKASSFTKRFLSVSSDVIEPRGLAEECKMNDNQPAAHVDGISFTLEALGAWEYLPGL